MPELPEPLGQCLLSSIELSVKTRVRACQSSLMAVDNALVGIRSPGQVSEHAVEGEECVR